MRQKVYVLHELIIRNNITPMVHKEKLLHNCLRIQCTPAVMAELQFKTYMVSGN